MDIGFIGLGSMGTRMVELLLDAGHHLTLWARRPASLDPFASRCDSATSPFELGATSELVGICVWDEHDVDEVLLGDLGVFAGMRPGGIVAVHSTIAPAACVRLSDEATRHGLELIDAPVSVGNSLPKLLVMVGGEVRAVERCRQTFDSFGAPVLRLGPVGSGQIAKLVNNTLLAATAGLADDAIALGEALGLDAEALTKALSSGSSRGTWSTLLASRPVLGTKGRTQEWAQKDVELMASLTSDAHVDRGSEVLRLGARGVDVMG